MPERLLWARSSRMILFTHTDFHRRDVPGQTGAHGNEVTHYGWVSFGDEQPDLWMRGGTPPAGVFCICAGTSLSRRSGDRLQRSDRCSGFLGGLSPAGGPLPLAKSSAGACAIRLLAGARSSAAVSGSLAGQRGYLFLVGPHVS